MPWCLDTRVIFCYHTIVINSLMTFNDPIATQFSISDWRRIKNALMTYVIIQEDKLKSQNVGDREWDELEEYNTLIRDIDIYVLQND